MRSGVLNSAYGKLVQPEKLYIQHSHLYAAASRGQVGLMKQLLEQGADPNWADEDGQTPIWVACWNGHPKAVELLAQSGANLNPTTRSGITPLIQAAICRKPACIEVRAPPMMWMRNSAHAALARVHGSAHVIALLADAVETWC